MANNIKVNTGRLSRDAGDVKTSIAAMTKMLEDLRGHNAALDGMWDGPSSEVFKMAFNNDLNTLQEIIAALNRIYNYENGAVKAYNRCEEKVANIVNGIRV